MAEVEKTGAEQSAPAAKAPALLKVHHLRPAAGAKKDDIQSEVQELGETQFFNNPPLPSAAERQAKAFHLHQSWTVRVAADDAAKLLDVAVRAGANDSGQIDWQLADPNAAQAEAAAKAIQRAQTQAKAMASGLGVHLGDLLYASNQVEGSPVRQALGALPPRQRAVIVLRYFEDLSEAEIAEALRVALDYDEHERVALSWSGGVLTKQPAVRAALLRRLETRAQYDVIAPRHEPGLGAALYARLLGSRPE